MGRSLHRFPTDPDLCKQWVIKIKRADFAYRDVTRHSRLCSDHFTDSDYQTSPSLLKSLGLTTSKPLLKSDAVPSVFVHNMPAKERRSEALMKRRKLQVSITEIHIYFCQLWIDMRSIMADHDYHDSSCVNTC